MPKNKYSSTSEIDDLDILEGGYTPFQRMAQSALSRTPEAFDYSELEKKYPTRKVTPMVSPYVQRELDEDMLQKKENEVALKVRQAQLNQYDSELNDKMAIAEQVIAARPEFAMLNPQDPDFQEKSDQLFMKYPKLESHEPFMSGMFARLLRVNEKAMERMRPKTPEEQAELRIKEAQAGIQESNLNEDIEMAKQMPEAKQYFLNLDPRSVDYEEQRDLGFIKYPSVAGSVVEKGIVARTDRLYDNWAKKNLSPDAAREKYQKAQKEKFTIQQLRDSSTIDRAEADQYIEMLDQSINEARGQLGMPSIKKATSPVSPQIPSAKEGKSYKQNGKIYKYTNGQFLEMP